MDNIERCKACNGRKQTAPLGGIYKTCPACKGVGSIARVEVVNNESEKLNLPVTPLSQAGNMSVRVNQSPSHKPFSSVINDIIPTNESVGKLMDNIVKANDANMKAFTAAELLDVIPAKKKMGRPKGWKKPQAPILNV